MEKQRRFERLLLFFITGILVQQLQVQKSLQHSSEDEWFSSLILTSCELHSFVVSCSQAKSDILVDKNIIRKIYFMV
ncbi:MAG: hypothetical protein M5R37_09230 [Melioribacteraceae bacterium]|nr:hypothetical protein [Melioribacteraceae bacterium]